MNYVNELFFDEPSFDDPGLNGNHVCPRCDSEFETVEELEYIEAHHACPSCSTHLTLEAEDEILDI